MVLSRLTVEENNDKFYHLFANFRVVDVLEISLAILKIWKMYSLAKLMVIVSRVNSAGLIKSHKRPEH